jgi:hypothetical protein
MGVVVAPLLVSGLACARPRGGSPPPRPPAPEPVEVILTVANHHWLDVTIYVEHDGQRTRVGTVTAVSTQQFVLPMRLLGMSREFQLLGEAIGSPSYVRTERLSIQPGQAIEWTLESDLRRSSVGVF